MPYVDKSKLLDKHLTALNLRRDGLTYDQIAERMGYSSRSGAYQAVMKGLKESMREPSGEIVSLELMRADALWEVMFEKALAGNEKAADRCIAIMNRRAKYLGLDFFANKDEDNTPASLDIPAHMVAPEFLEPYRDIRDARHVEYTFSGGRGSTKSSFLGLVGIMLLGKHPQGHGLAVRQVGDTLRDSVYADYMWAIMELGLEDKFRFKKAPLEIEYIPTGQKIFFRGADDPAKIKSIRPPFGHIVWVRFEELDQFKGPEAIRSIEQSAVRGGDIAYIFKSWNTPRTKNNWVNKFVSVPDPKRYDHHSTYLDVPKEWLGQPFFDRAEHLKEINPDAYEHEYLGVANGLGGLVFENVRVEEIADDVIKEFDRPLQGLDWGYFPDPLHYVKCYYRPADMTLYIYDEYRANKMGNREAYDALVGTDEKPGILDVNNLLIADSAEPKSVADFKSYGAMIRGAEKGPDSVDYSIKWLQSLKAIIIDPRRAPHAADEFLNYELERDKEGEFISAYPDKNNHAIDAVRYATNLIWRVRGQ